MAIAIHDLKALAKKADADLRASERRELILDLADAAVPFFADRMPREAVLVNYIAAARCVLHGIGDLRAEALARVNLQETTAWLGLLPWAARGTDQVHRRDAMAVAACTAALAETVTDAAMGLWPAKIDFEGIFGKHGVRL